MSGKRIRGLTVAAGMLCWVVLMASDGAVFSSAERGPQQPFETSSPQEPKEAPDERDVLNPPGTLPVPPRPEEPRAWNPVLDFEELDEDGDESLSQYEIQKGYDAVLEKRAFLGWDRDNDGLLSREEYEQAREEGLERGLTRERGFEQEP